MVCKVCGKELREGAKFCPACGTPCEAPAVVAAPVAESAPVVETPVAEPAKIEVEKTVLVSKEEEAAPAPAPKAPAAPKATPASNDVLIAVITAAVAAAMQEENGGQAAPAFRVVSFRKIS